jgi:hypothetical protein
MTKNLNNILHIELNDISLIKEQQESISQIRRVGNWLEYFRTLNIIPSENYNSQEVLANCWLKTPIKNIPQNNNKIKDEMIFDFYKQNPWINAIKEYK